MRRRASAAAAAAAPAPAFGSAIARLLAVRLYVAGERGNLGTWRFGLWSLRRSFGCGGAALPIAATGPILTIGALLPIGTKLRPGFLPLDVSLPNLSRRLVASGGRRLFQLVRLFLVF